MLADFILSLEEVDVAIVSSQRADGLKFSVRSETSAVHAGQLIHDALQGIGDGGGHATMAGGLVRGDRLTEPYLKEQIRERMLEQIGILRNPDKGTAD